MCEAQEGAAVDYLAQTGARAVIYSGKGEENLSRVKGHPYLDTQEYRAGSLNFDGRLYPGVGMRLNVHTDELVLLSPDRRFGVVVLEEHVDSASFPAYEVFYNRQERRLAGLPDEGYYARLYNGRHTVWKRERKLIERVHNGMHVEEVFATQTRYYLCKDGRCQNAGNKRSLLKLFAPKKKELKLYIKQQSLDFKNAPDAAIVGLTSYYESL
jgi:3',5'-cyclic AMP phosphodiesterase CpdA